MRRWLFVGVVALIFLAGCQGASDAGLTPGSPGGGETPGIGDAPYPDGATATGLNGSILLAAHNDSLQAAGSYRLEGRIQQQRRRTRIGNRFGYAVDVEAKRVRGTTQTVSNRGSQTISQYYDDGTQYLRIERASQQGNRTQFGTVNATWSNVTKDRMTGFSAFLIRRFDFEAINTQQADDGTTLIQYRSVGVVPGETNRSAPIGNESSANLTVSSNGAIRRASIRATLGGGRVSASYRYLDIGNTTVSAPPWIDRARNASRPTPQPTRTPAADSGNGTPSDSPATGTPTATATPNGG